MTAPRMEQANRRGSVTPSIAPGALSLVILLLVATLALTARQPPPPSIAEFAPQAVEQLKDAPSDQGTGEGSGGGSGQGDGEGSTTSTTVRVEEEAPIEVGNVKKCVGDPPRQIEDPQSPPCVPYFAGDNGGATGKGVTRDEIRVALPYNLSFSATEEPYSLIADFFNRRFQLYNRRINITSITQVADCSTTAPQKANAEYVDKQLDGFASLFWDECDGGPAFFGELARRGIVGAAGNSPFREVDLRELRPHVFAYMIAPDRQLTALGDWACKRLGNGQPARFGGPTVQDDVRKFGLVLTTPLESPINEEPLMRSLATCGITDVPMSKSRSFGTSETDWDNRAIALRDAGVTSVFCICSYGDRRQLLTAASRQLFFPEWISTSIGDGDLINVNNSLTPSEQRQNMFGLSFRPRQLRIEDHPWYWAAKEEKPSWNPDPGKLDSLSQALIDKYYRSLLLLASGIQLAGPSLNAETFERGLQRAIFPNPEHRINAGKVGFGGQTHTMTLDATEIWWSDDGRTPFRNDAPGAWCYVEGGRRYAAGAFKSGDAGFFDGPCDSGAPPPGD